MSLAVNPSDAGPYDHVSEPPERASLESISDTVKYAAAAMHGLQDVLDRLDASLVRAQDEREDRLAETRLGTLFVQAQEFTDRAVAEAREHSRQIVEAAQVEAAGIVASARHEAERLVEEAERRHAPDPVVLAQLQSSIEVFHKVNGELVDELATLHRSLSEPPVPHSAPPSPPPPPFAPSHITQLMPDLDHRAPDIPSAAQEMPGGNPSSVTAGLSGDWMHDDRPLWEGPLEYEEPPRRYWSRG